MTDDLTYVRTPSGDNEIAAQFSLLRDDQKEVLQLVEPKASFAQLRSKVPQLAEAVLRQMLEELASMGYIEPLTADMDAKACFAQPVSQPTIQLKQQAERQTLSGMPALKEAGYYVNILSRPANRILPSSGDTYHVFIIDADEINTLVSVRMLLLNGFNTQVAVNRDEIVAGLNRKPRPDVIAMDVVLPDIIGLDLLGRLREHPRFKSVPIIVMTAKANHDDVVAALSYGASCYMTKPFKPEALLDSINAVLGIG